MIVINITNVHRDEVSELYTYLELNEWEYSEFKLKTENGIEKLIKIVNSDISSGEPFYEDLIKLKMT